MLIARAKCTDSDAFYNEELIIDFWSFKGIVVRKKTILLRL